MTRPILFAPFSTLAAGAFLMVALFGCKSKDEGNGAPPPAKVVQVADMDLISIDGKDAQSFPWQKPIRSKLRPS